MPLHLTDAELDSVLRAARPLAHDARDAFLLHVAQQLSMCTEVGPGVVSRVCREAQKKFFDPPDLGNGAAPKYRVHRFRARPGLPSAPRPQARPPPRARAACRLPRRLHRVAVRPRTLSR